jgi:TM2 domain-containing membrane protein YozV
MAINHLRKIEISFTAFYLLFAVETFSQNGAGCDLKFINHLINSGNFQEALFLLNSSGCSLYPMYDSINFFKGMALYSLNRLDSSSASLTKVTTASSFYQRSHFLAAYNYTFTGNYKKAVETLEITEMMNEKMISIRNFQFAGINLLQKNIPLFNEWLNKTDTIYPDIAKSSSKLLAISADMINHKDKSPLVAGLMSGIIPGSGKLYAGKRGSAISSFLTTVGFGLVTWESYRKTGLNSFRTIAFGTIFAISYTANIYGSVISVRIIENEYRENVKNSILFNLHLSLGYSSVR